MPEYTADVVCTPLPNATPLPDHVEVINTRELGRPEDPEQVTLRFYLTEYSAPRFVMAVLQFLRANHYELVRFEDPLINRTGMAAEYEVPASTVTYWFRDPSFPAPVADVIRGRVWHFHDVDSWLVNHGYREEPAKVLRPTWLEVALGYTAFQELVKKYGGAPPKPAPNDDYKAKGAEAMRRIHGGF